MLPGIVRQHNWYRHRVSLLTAALVVTWCGVRLFAQTPAPPMAADSQTGAAAAALGQQGIVQLVISFFIPRFLEWAKRWKYFPMWEVGAARLNRIVAVLVAAGQSAGLTAVYHRGTTLPDGSVTDGWQFIIGSNHSSFEEFAVAGLIAFGSQQFFYEQMPKVQASALADAFLKALSAPGGRDLFAQATMASKPVNPPPPTYPKE